MEINSYGRAISTCTSSREETAVVKWNRQKSLWTDHNVAEMIKQEVNHYIYITRFTN
jgi:hypothetical protein